MNRDEILAMEAGREMDALVAEKVMGFAKVVREYDKRHREGLRSFVYDSKVSWFGKETPEYSTDISAAWQVVEKMKQKREDVNEDFLRTLTRNCPKSNDEPYKIIGWWFAISNKAEAICRAALLAVMGQ